jgi:GNAT superfamily N-acetyltransferase
MAKTFTEGQNYVVAHPEKFGLYKPAEWSEDYNKENIQTRFAFYTYKDDPSTLYLSNVFVEESSRNHGFGTRILKAAEKVAEAIGAITISLKVKQNSPANAWYRKNGYGYVAFEDGYDWLEKNLEYMKPNKQEWSDEDADMLNCCISSIEEAKENRYAYKETDGDTSYDREIDWLKSLRPQPHWKPSEEQMKALEDAFRKDGGNEYRKVINSLYCDLQKLL